jgi:hypothetical protein
VCRNRRALIAQHHFGDPRFFTKRAPAEP